MAEVPVPKSVSEGSKSLVTTALGLAAGILNYFVALGPNLPKTRGEWGTAAFSAILAALGLVVPDANKLAEVGKKK